MSSTHERELLEVERFWQYEDRMLPEERDDSFKQIISTTNDETVEVFPVVVMPPVDVHLARSEELTEIVETARRCLRPESRRNHVRPGIRLYSRYGPAGLVAGRVRSRSNLLRLQNRSPNHETRSVFPADFPHPSRCHHGKRPVGRYEVVRDSPGFPAYSQMRTAPLLVRGATNCLQRLTVSFGHDTLGPL